MSDREDDIEFGGLSGLDRVLASVGVDTSSFSDFYSKTSGGNAKSSGILASVDVDSGDDDKYEDDISDHELQPESAADIAARKKSEADAERMIRRGLALQKETQGRGVVPVKKNKQEEEREVAKKIWPEFRQGERLRMSEVFYETPAEKREHEASLARAKRRKIVHEQHKIKIDPLLNPSPTSTFLLSTLNPLRTYEADVPLYNRSLGANFDRKWIEGARQLKRREMTRPPADLYITHKLPDLDSQEDVVRPLDLVDWEKDIIKNPLVLPPPGRQSDPLEPRNTVIESSDWIKDVIWDSRLVAPDLLQSDDEVEAILTTSTSTTAQVARTAAPTSTFKAPLDPFNLSNDHLYEHSRESRFRIRQTFGNIQVFHAGPAKTLQLPFYKTTLSKAEARAWKRPPLQIPVGITLGFSKLKANPKAVVSSKKKAMMVDPSERFKTSKDLTMAEKGPYVLLEFSEEYPPMMSGYGMGTTIVNYYRKKDDKDETVPKLDFGQPHILGVGDAEPFFLGFVNRGEVTQVAHNNLYRAPMFRHTPETTDFLAIRQTTNGHSTYYLRPIANIYTVGQTMPGTDEVPGPHARKNTNYAKHRLMVIAWLIIQKARNKIIKLSKLIKYFPDHVDVQIRQKLKVKGTEFLQHSNLEGPKQGLWGLNPGYRDPEDKPFPNNRADVQALCTPEEAMRYEAMQVGARHLYDAGYTQTAEGKREEVETRGGDDDENTGMDIEQQLAVWFTTLNYQKAATAKAWLLLHGEGDPTGRGEGFSFLKTNMKSYFLRKGETEQSRKMDAERAGGSMKISNVEQQRIYEEEKRRVWDLQWKALSDTRPPELTPEDEEDSRTAGTPMPGTGGAARGARGDSRMASSRAGSRTPWGDEASPSREDSPAFSDDNSVYAGLGEGQDKVLRIKRIVRGEEKIEIIRDPAVIKSYIMRREEKRVDDMCNNPALANLAPTGDPIEDAARKTALERLISKGKRNQIRRQARNKYLNRSEGVDDGTDNRRKCSACGQLGHTRANKACPRFNQSSIQPSPSAQTPNMGTPSGYGMGYMGEMGGDGSTPMGGTSLKIKLGMGSK